MRSFDQGLGKRWEGRGLAAAPAFALAMILRALVVLIAMLAVAWANAGRPHQLGRLVGEPNGLESVATKRERLTFDLRPLVITLTRAFTARAEVAAPAGDNLAEDHGLPEEKQERR